MWGHVECKEKMRNAYRLLVRKLKAKHHKEELGSINIKLDLEWIQLIQDRVW
jgi:hypothetical protein